MEITFENLPMALANLTNEVSEIKRMLLSKSNMQSSEVPDQFLNIKEAALYLDLTVPTIYSMVSRNELPVMKRSKRLYFSRLELAEYIKVGRKKTKAEIEIEVNAYFKKKGSKN